MTENKPSYFDFSRYDLYKKCPQSYKWKYIEDRKPKKPANYYYALPGIVIQKLFEHFYNDAWFLKKGACREFMYSKAPEIYEGTLKWLNVDWQSRIAKKTKHEVYQEFLDMIGKNLDVIKEHKLLGQLAKSEYKIRTHLDKNKYIILTSKIDFLLKNHLGLQILDGKATSNKKNYLDDPTQLYFYAMMYYFKFKKYPDKIGYWFWRTAEIKYVDLDLDKVEEIKEGIQKSLYDIYKKRFPAKPEYKTCLFCNYADECLERTKDIAEKQAAKAVTKVTDADLDLFL